MAQKWAFLYVWPTVSVPTNTALAFPDTLKHTHLQHCARLAPLTVCYLCVIQASECLIGVKILDSTSLEDRMRSWRGAQLRRHPRDRRAGEHNPRLPIPPPPAPIGVPPCSQPIPGVLSSRKSCRARASWPLAARCSAASFALICTPTASRRRQDRTRAERNVRRRSMAIWIATDRKLSQYVRVGGCAGRLCLPIFVRS